MDIDVADPLALEVNHRIRTRAPLFQSAPKCLIGQFFPFLLKKVLAIPGVSDLDVFHPVLGVAGRVGVIPDSHLIELVFGAQIEEYPGSRSSDHAIPSERSLRWIQPRLF